MPPNTVYVGRPTIWGNPFRTIEEFKAAIKDGSIFDILGDRYWHNGNVADYWDLDIWLHGLKGKNLACWCPPGVPCHADVLLEIANKLKG